MSTAFDARTSRTLDRLVHALETLDASPSLRRCWLRLLKRLAERHVPAFRPARKAVTR